MKQRPPLYKHQEETVNYLLGRNATAVLSEQGTGKTRSVIEFINRKYISKQFRVLVVCPATLMGVWEREVNDYADLTDSFMLRGPKQKRTKLLKEWKPGWYVLNYEGIRVLSEKGKSVGQQWDVIICDEMTRIKTPTAKQSKAVHKLAHDNPQAIRVGITGTPITQSPLDVFSQYLFIEPKIFGTKFYKFKNHYAIEKKMYMGARSFPKVVGYKNVSELVRKMHDVSIRHTKKQCLDLPDKVRQTIEVEWDKPTKKVYSELASEMITESNGKTISVPNALSKLSKLRQVCGGFVYQDGTGPKPLPYWVNESPEKLKALIELLNDREGEQCIVWAYFREDLKAIAKALEKAKISYAPITGAVELAERTRSVERLQSGKVRVALAQCGVAQYGLTMTAATTAIFYSQGFSVEDRMQAEDRNHRIGTKSSVTYIDLVMASSVDSSISKSLSKGQQLANNLTNSELKKVIDGTMLT